MTFAGWQALTASFGYLIGTLIQALILYTHPNYTPAAWHGVLLYWAVILFAVFINTALSGALAIFESFVFVLHIFGFLAVLIPLVYFGPHEDASIYTLFLNEGNWPTQGLSFLIGLSGSVFTLLGQSISIYESLVRVINNLPGADSAVHVSRPKCLLRISV